MRYSRCVRFSHIEVECKFRFNEDTERRIRKAGSSLGSKEFTDVYWDTNGFALTTRDMWLRERNTKWELKLPLSFDGQEQTVDVYDELHGLEKIQAHLAQLSCLENAKDGRSPMSRFGLKPFAEITTIRTSYLLPFEDIEVRVDLDRAGGYLIGECELILAKEDATNIIRASELLREFCAKFALDTTPPIRGKVLEFIHVNSQNHYKMLEECGLIRRKLMRTKH